MILGARRSDTKDENHERLPIIWILMILAGRLYVMSLLAAGIDLTEHGSYATTNTTLRMRLILQVTSRKNLLTAQRPSSDCVRRTSNPDSDSAYVLGSGESTVDSSDPFGVQDINGRVGVTARDMTVDNEMPRTTEDNTITK